MDNEFGTICPTCLSWGHDIRCTSCGTMKGNHPEALEESEPAVIKPKKQAKGSAIPGAIKPITLMRERLKFLESEMKRLKSFESEYSQLKAAIAAISIPRKKRERI